MRHSLPITSLLVLALLVFGCGSDKPNGPEPPKPQRIVVTQGTSAPPLTSTNDAIWDAITPIAVDISSSLAPSPVISEVMAISDSVYVQAVTFDDSLFLRISWADNSHNVWRGAFSVNDTDADLGGNMATIFNAPDSIGRQEDHLWVLFAGLVSGDWDGLNWRALTTDSTFLAEGINLHRAAADSPWVQVRDAGTVEVARHNFNTLNQTQPMYFHEDTSDYAGFTLFENDALRPQDFFIRGWDIGQQVPFYILDSTKHRLSAAERGSRWDTKTISNWSSSTYTVVLCRPMNTEYADDVVLVDSVKTKVGVFDNQMDINTGGTGRGFSKEFWLIF